MLAWSLAMLDDHDLIDGIVMVVPEGYEERASLLADDLARPRSPPRCPEAPRAPTRWQPGWRASRRARTSCSCTTPPGRWCRPRSSIASSPALRAGAEGAVPALPLADTVKRVGPDGSVAETLDRGALRAVQTPQGFPLAVLREALDERAGDATDCASMVERLGRPVVCVEGDERAFKVTTPADLARAEQLAVADEE